MRRWIRCFGWAVCVAYLPVGQVGAQALHSGHDMSATHAAGADMKGHMEDDATYYKVSFDRLEWHEASDESALVWNAKAWVGKDFNRLYVRSEGESVNGNAQHAAVEALWVRPLSPWWNLGVGLRQDMRPAPSRSWLALGAIGLAPYRFAVEATAYLATGGRTAVRLETEYDLLLTNRLVLQPRLELNAYGESDRSRGIGAGLSDMEAGLRLRYEIRREFAPYIGLVWARRFGLTEEIAQAAGRPPGELQSVVGLRAWF